MVQISSRPFARQREQGSLHFDNVAMDALAFLKSTAKPGRLYVLHGDEAFLKRQVLRALRRRVLGPDDDDQGVSTYAGDKATFAEVFDELDTVPFFYPRRLIVVAQRASRRPLVRSTLTGIGNPPSGPRRHPRRNPGHSQYDVAVVPDVRTTCQAISTVGR